MRLTLEPLTRAAAEAVLLGQRLPGWAPGYPTDGDAEVARMVLAMPPEPDEPRFGPQVLLLDGEAVGGAGFFGPPDPDGVLRCGYGVAAPSRGRGLATEAVRALLELARADPRAREVRAEVRVDNAPSHRVLQKCGFAPVTTGWVPPGHLGYVRAV